MSDKLQFVDEQPKKSVAGNDDKLKFIGHFGGPELFIGLEV
jgi:hypothetical protein